MANPNFDPLYSSDQVFIGTDQTKCLTDELDTMSTDIEGKAPNDHTHTGYAEAEHTHSGYANSEHTHSGYAESDHNHDSEYVSVDGGTINGDVNVAGVIRSNGQQGFYYATSTATQTIGTNNATGGTTIGCGSSADVTCNGARLKTSSILPKANASYQIGNTSNRFNGIYLVNSPNVSSDERLKKNIKPIASEVAGEFIKELPVVEYQYKDDKDEDKRIGLIAQEVIKANPEFAKYFVEQDEKGFYSMTPADLVFPLILAVQALQKEVEELKGK